MISVVAGDYKKGLMTLAICINCGAEKVGAFTPCRKCGFDRQAPEDQGKALALSDHNMSSAELRETAARIKTGEELKFDDLVRVA